MSIQLDNSGGDFPDWFMKTPASMLPLVVLFVASCGGPDTSAYQHLKNPKISAKERQKMMVVSLAGDPNKTAKVGISHLFKTFYKIKGDVKGMQSSPPHARWPKPLETPRNEWVGIYGLPVPEALAALPPQDKKDPEVKLEYWEYGEAAEILHVGSYDKEGPTVERLHAFIKAQGYEISGPHEEIYIKGPGMIFAGDPNTYETVIRYPVKKSQ